MMAEGWNHALSAAGGRRGTCIRSLSTFKFFHQVYHANDELVEFGS